MDRRSWLWRRKSSPSGETDSSGSISSHSERFSDDQALLNHNIQSPEVTSKAAPSIEELQDNVKTLSDKLSEALVNIHAKEDLVKQHAKVAEEAVSGWEKAESEVLVLKRHAEVLMQKNSVLEERVGHLDGALKECLRQLRQAKEEQEQKVHEAVSKRSDEWESTKSELENQIVNLKAQLQTAETEAVTSTFPDLCIKLEAAEKENSILKLELLSKTDELKLRTSERDLSIHAAETASKQHLESIKKVAKLEAECRRVKMLARKVAPVNDQRSVTASSVYVESFTDSQSDCGERLSAIDTESCKMSGMVELNDCEPLLPNLWASSSIVEVDQFKNEKPVGRNFMVSSDEIFLMNDFLEMERLAALPEAEEGSCFDSGNHNGENLKAELEAMINRTAELEEKLEKLEEEKVELKTCLTECQHQLEASRDQLDETEMKLTELKIQLVMANEARRTVEAEIEATNLRLEKSSEKLAKAEGSLLELKSQLNVANEVKNAAEMEVKTTREELVKSTKLLEEAEVNLFELSSQLSTTNKSKCKAEAELEATTNKKEIAESRIKVLELELQTLKSRVHNLEEDIQNERTLSGEAFASSLKLNAEILGMKSESQLWKAATVGEVKTIQEKELALAAGKFAECQKTIASLGQQLNYLATLEDFLIDSDRPTEIH
ncbi:hypothetical protein ACH5RR_012900 [Cinchona calisaya]|uniref:Filament-like plant protein n=1 Tax=Cinchona calisaya TaxID=153742 RepID=A0ABD3AAJ1_9GENT